MIHFINIINVGLPNLDVLIFFSYEEDSFGSIFILIVDGYQFIHFDQFDKDILEFTFDFFADRLDAVIFFHHRPDFFNLNVFNT